MTHAEQKTKVYYDAECKMCQVSADLIDDQSRTGTFELINAHTAEPPAGLTREHMLEEIYVVLPDNTRYHGADAVLYLMNAYWYLKPVVFIGRLPGIIHCLRVLYRFIARNRYFFGHTHTS